MHVYVNVSHTWTRVRVRRHGTAICGLVGLPTAESGYRDHSRGSSELATMVDGGAQLKFTVP